VAPDTHTGNTNVSHNYSYITLYSSPIKIKIKKMTQTIVQHVKITLRSGLHKIIFTHIPGWDLASRLENMVIFKATV
jgi:hypothetical protein